MCLIVLRNTIEAQQNQNCGKGTDPQKIGTNPANKEKYSGVHPRVSTLIQPSFQRKKEKRTQRKKKVHTDLKNL